MVRIRSGSLVALIALSLGAAACKKSDNKPSADKTAEATKTGSAVAATDQGNNQSAAPAAGGAIAGPAGQDLALLPVDSDVVFAINFAQIRGSALWKEFVEPKLATANIGPIQKFKALCGFDPLENLKSIAVGAKGSGSDVQGAVVIHGYEKSKAMTCFDKDGVAEVEKDGSKVMIDGDTVMITDKNGQHLGFTFVNDDTALMVMGTNAETKDGIKKVASGSSGLQTSATVVKLYSKINTQDSMWYLVNGKAPFMAQLQSMGVKPQAMFGSVNVTDGVSVDLHMRLGSPDEANNLVTMLKGELGQAKQFFDKVDVSSDGQDAKFDISMSKDKLKLIAGMFAGMAGGMLGGGGGMGAMGAP